LKQQQSNTPSLQNQLKNSEDKRQNTKTPRQEETQRKFFIQKSF